MSDCTCQYNDSGLCRVCVNGLKSRLSAAEQERDEMRVDLSNEKELSTELLEKLSALVKATGGFNLTQAHDAIAKLRAQLATAIGALEWYADSDLYERYSPPSEPAPIAEDNGKLAQEALDKIKGDKK